MFGLLRFLLAYLVVVSHLVGSDYLAHFGFYAVVGFFVIAGYVMTAALNEVYAFDGLRFCVNRALRLLPPYYLVSAITLAVIAAMPAEAGRYLKFWHADMRLRDVLLNLSVLPMQTSAPSFRMVPPFWSIAIEIEMYLLLFLVVARQPGWALVAFAVGLWYHLVCSYVDLGWAAHYFPATSAVLPFAAGALVYFCRRRQACAVAPLVTIAAFAVWCLNIAAGGWIFRESYIFGAGYYVGVASFTVVVAGLANRQCGPMIARLDRVLGEWAYFVFLVQWLAGFAVAVTVLPGQERGWTLAGSGHAGARNRRRRPCRIEPAPRRAIAGRSARAGKTMLARFRRARGAHSVRVGERQPFLTQILHQAVGLISPSTKLLALGGTNWPQLLHC